MPGITRVNLDTAGAVITGPGNVTVFTNGLPTSVLGDSVTPHPPGPPHSPIPPTMVEGSPTVFCGGIPTVRQGDKASCDDPATGSSDVFAD